MLQVSNTSAPPDNKRMFVAQHKFVFFFFYLHSYGVFVLSKNCRAFILTSHQLVHTPFKDITLTLNVAGLWQASIRIWVEATRFTLK